MVPSPTTREIWELLVFLALVVLGSWALCFGVGYLLGRR